jgi:two-component system sensor histidine kinase TctE
VLALLMAVGGVAIATAALLYGRNAAQRAYDRLLIGAASQIAGSVALRDGRVIVDLPTSAFELLALAPDDRIVYAVFDPDGQVVTGYDIAPPPGPDRLYNGELGGEPARLASIRRLFAERGFAGPVDVVVGQTMRARRALAAEITRNALVVVGVAGLLMSALAAFSIRSALGPLRRVEAALAARSPQELSPLDVPVPREIGGLVHAMNQFMARIGRQVEATRTLIADASHQIRTPIAALRAQADLAAEETDPARQQAIVARIHERSVNLSRLTDQMLNRALIIHRADAVPRERLDLRTVAMRTVEESDHDLFASEEVLRLDLPEDPVWCDGDALSLV